MVPALHSACDWDDSDLPEHRLHRERYPGRTAGATPHNTVTLYLNWTSGVRSWDSIVETNLWNWAQLKSAPVSMLTKHLNHRWLSSKTCWIQCENIHKELKRVKKTCEWMNKPDAMLIIWPAFWSRLKPLRSALLFTGHMTDVFSPAGYTIDDVTRTNLCQGWRLWDKCWDSLLIHRW